MTATFLRYLSESGPRWAAVDGDTALPLPQELTTTADILSDGVTAAADARNSAPQPSISGPDPGVGSGSDSGSGYGRGGGSTGRLAIAQLELLAPTPGARIFCQGANYRTHMIESGMDPDRMFNMFFTKSTASLAGPHDDIIRPAHVRLLDYEVELGLVLRAPITHATAVTDATLVDYVGGFVVANDVSARDVQLPQGQWYKGKSYRTFCPVGPYLVVPDADHLGRWRQLRLTLSVNGELRQDSLAGDMAFGPAATLSEWSQLEDLGAGDLLLTGTPGGVALQPPPPRVQKIAGLLPEARRWELFVRSQGRSGAYLKPGDLIEASIRTDDKTLDLGTQRTYVR